MPTPTHIEPPHIARAREQQVALIPLRVPRSEIMNAMAPAYAELEAVLKAQDIHPTGPWFAHHLHRPTDIFDFEVCSPVDKPVVPSGRVMNGNLRAATVVRTVYSGPYEGLAAAWGEFVDWIAANGHQTATDLWEVYLVNPHDSADSSTWRTELNAPLLS